MKKFLVGGAVRDKLLGLEPKDIDFVVVGSTVDEMLAAGFSQVGKDFPVFLHPDTGDQYALARKERKVAPGYNGFTTEHGVDVTLEDDLLRRDLTINSMAMDDDGNLIDPFNGQADLTAGILRHTSEAFAEDPLRVLRLARFAARYKFAVAPETIELAKKLVIDGELDTLSPDRVWVELSKGFAEDEPNRMVDVLRRTDALKSKALSFLFGENPPTVIMTNDNPELVAVLSMPNLRQLEPKVLNGLRIPKTVQSIASALKTLLDSFNRSNVPTAAEVVRLINSLKLTKLSSQVESALEGFMMMVPKRTGDAFRLRLAAGIDGILSVDMEQVVADAQAAGVAPKDAVWQASISAVESKLR